MISCQNTKRKKMEDGGASRKEKEQEKEQMKGGRERVMLYQEKRNTQCITLSHSSEIYSQINGNNNI